MLHPTPPGEGVLREHPPFFLKGFPMKCNRGELLSKLTLLSAVLAKDAIISISSGVAFAGRGSVFMKVDLGLPEITGCLTGDKLLQYLSKASVDEIDIAMEENEFLVRAGKSRVGIPMSLKVSPTQELLKDPIFDVQPVKLPDDFTDALKLAAICVARENNPRDFLRCVAFMGKRIHSSEGSRIMVWDLESPILHSLDDPTEATFCLHYEVVDLLLKFPATHITIGEKGVLFQSGDCSMLCPLYSSPTLCDMDVSRFTTAFEGSEIEFPLELQDILFRADLFCDEDLHKTKFVSIEMAKGKITVSCKGAGGWFREFARIKYDGPVVSTMLNVGFLAVIAGRTLKAKMGTGSTENMIQFYSDGFKDGSSYFYTFAKVKQAEEAKKDAEAE